MECGASVRIVLPIKPATMRHGDRATNGKAQPKAILLCRKEGLEHTVLATGGKPDTGVGDEHFKVFIVRSSRFAAWVLPVAGGLLFSILVGLWLTSALWFFTTTALATT